MVLFKIEVGQIWKKGEGHYHVPRVEHDHGSNRWQVIRCVLDSVSWVWVYPRTPEDEPIWFLADFQDAELISSTPFVKRPPSP